GWREDPHRRLDRPDGGADPRGQGPPGYRRAPRGARTSRGGPSACRRGRRAGGSAGPDKLSRRVGGLVSTLPARLDWGNSAGATGRTPTPQAQADRTLMTDLAYQLCINPTSRTIVPLRETDFACPRCGGLLDVAYDWDGLPVPASLREFEARWARRGDP